jgi:hypothetical protein
MAVSGIFCADAKNAAAPIIAKAPSGGPGHIKLQIAPSNTASKAPLARDGVNMPPCAPALRLDQTISVLSSSKTAVKVLSNTNFEVFISKVFDVTKDLLLKKKEENTIYNLAAFWEMLWTNSERKELLKEVDSANLFGNKCVSVAEKCGLASEKSVKKINASSSPRIISKFPSVKKCKNIFHKDDSTSHW